MAAHRLPIPGQDNNVWGDVLNDFLAQAHKSDGALQSGIIVDDNINGSAGISRTKLAANVQTSLNSADSSVQTVNGKSPTSGAVTLTAADVSAMTQSTADGLYVAK